MEMKRLWICLLALLVLVGCGGNPTDVGETLVVPQSAGSYRLNMETEWMEYDPSVDSIWCILSYEGEGEPLEFGAEYRLEVQTDSGWETRSATGMTGRRAWTKRYTKSFLRRPCMKGPESRSRYSTPSIS